MQRNRLAAETSSYLLRHAGNPVDWYAWGEAAFAHARRDHKPVLLSIGYSACHGCQVMARESYEDPATAALMNRLFVNIKVDREERPDLDKIYQLAQQLITRHAAGWPLTLFLTPDQVPFFGGTYFPREPSGGMPAFRDLLERVAEYFHGHAGAIEQQNAQLMLALERLVPDDAATDFELDAAPLQEARRALEESFDTRYGGFGGAPKFPPAGGVERCLRQWYETAHQAVPDLKALYMATLTLTRMAEGGIYDRRGGFSRYADESWTLPHGEKTLYGNAMLLHGYAQAGLATGETLYAQVVAGTADWLLRDMRSPEGGFHASAGVDAEGAPRRDEKILTAWNALAIKGMAAAGRMLQRPDLTDAATAAVDFIRQKLWDGRLLATYENGRAHLAAYLDDYAFLADALLELLQSRWRSSDLEFALALLEVLLDRFQDPAGGFFFTPSDHEHLIYRSKSFGDDALPSGNGVAASVLCRMGYLLGELRYVDAAQRTLAAASRTMLEHPLAHMSSLNALDDFLKSTQIVIIRGKPAEAQRWAGELQSLYAPTRMIFAIPDDVGQLPAPLAEKRAEICTTAYVCTGMTSSAPMTELRDVARRLVVRLTQ